MQTIDQLYEGQVKPLPIVERLRLVRLIMDDLTETASQWVVETSDAWSQEDLVDASRASLLHAARILAEDEDV